MNRCYALALGLRLLRWPGSLVCLMLAVQVSWAQTHEARGAHDAGEMDARHAGPGRRDARPDARPDAQPSLALQPASQPSPALEIPSGDRRQTEPAVDSSAFVQGQDRLPFIAPHRRMRTRAQARLTGLAAMAARHAHQTNLTASGTFEAPRDMGSPSELRVLPRQPKPSLTAAEPAAAPPPASMGALDESIVKEIRQRKTMFRMCYESARRRGVTVTRADVRWILSPDGSVRDVVVEVAQDAILARCIRVIASRPFPASLPQEIPVAIPLLFVSER